MVKQPEKTTPAKAKAKAKAPAKSEAKGISSPAIGNLSIEASPGGKMDLDDAESEDIAPAKGPRKRPSPKNALKAPPAKKAKKAS